MAHLSKEHRDGWGLAVFEASAGWSLHKGVLCANEDARFRDLAVGSRGELLVSHIRQKTVGETSLDNTHPFSSGRWIFAHNGTIKDIAFLRERASEQRRAQVRGQTDSELLFAYLLTRLDAAGVTDADASRATDAAVRDAAAEARAHQGIGAFNFLLSNGTTMYAHRFGRTLCLLERSPHDEVRPSRRSQDGTVVETPWSQRRHAIFVASEHMTNEPWQTIDEGMLLRIDRTPVPHWRLVA